MRKSLILHFFLIALLTSLYTGCDESDEREITDTEVPIAIIEAFNKAYPKAIVSEYREEVEDGTKIHEISFRHGDQKISILYSHDGLVIALEETIPAADLPWSIHDELENNFDKYQIKEIEKITKGANIFYEVVLVAESEEKNKKYNLLLSKEGRLIDKEEEDENEDQ